MIAEKGGEQVLLVDDNPTNLQVLFKTLEGSGYRLLAARDGEAAIKIARKAKPSLILLDVMMPGIDGFQVCEALKSDPDTENIAVIFLSALTDSQSKVHGLAVGGVDYIAKPFQSDEVLARVKTHIKIHRLERALAARNIALEDENLSILNAVEEGIVGLDQEGRVSSINRQALVLIEQSEADVLGKTVEELQLFNNDESVVANIKLLINNSEPLRRAFVELSTAQGASISVSLTGSPRQGGSVLVWRDIRDWLKSQQALQTAREEIDEQRQHMAHIERLSTGGEMAAGIAHEVNQPLTAVVNYARVCQRMIATDGQPNTEKVSEVLDKIAVQAERASAVIQRMRSYVKKPTGGKERLSMNTMLAEVVALAEVDSRTHGIDIEFVRADALADFQADEVQIQQVALNLLRNAIEASAAVDVNRTVQIASFGNADTVGFVVKDWGAGLDPDVETQLFSPFVSSKEGGMGIGLSVSQSIVQAHGGDLQYSPNPEGGAMFRCEFPLYQS